MDNFSFLKSLKETSENEVKKPKLTEGIKYQEYEVPTYDNKSHTVYIPLRETIKFEESLEDMTIVTETDIRSLLRTHNGVTEI